MSSRGASLGASVLLFALLGGGCEGCHNPPPPSGEDYEDEELSAEVLEAPDEARADEEPPPAVAETPVRVQSGDARDHEPPPILPAAHGDRDNGTSEPVTARRYVYRLRMTVPAGLGSSDDRLALPSAELVLDVSHDRLRARFAGSGWPVAAGSEVRLRRDFPGVYVFDGMGGRPLEPSDLASWFEGGRVTRHGPPLRVYPHYGARRRQRAFDDEETPGELVCAFLAELAGEPRENVMRRCERGAPQLWRLGFWRAEQTADVPMELPRSALRADERDPPESIRAEDSRAFLEPAALARITPDGAPAEAPADVRAPPEGLRVVNDSATRLIVTLQGVPLGWVDAGAEGSFIGLSPGTYAVGAIRPLGAVVQRRRPVSVPGIHRVCDKRCR